MFFSSKNFPSKYEASRIFQSRKFFRDEKNVGWATLWAQSEQGANHKANIKYPKGLHVFYRPSMFELYFFRVYAEQKS